MLLPANIKIKENSWRAKLAAKIMRSSHVAIVFGKTIHLWGFTKAYLLNNENLLRHELKHVEQYQQHGYFGFLTKYLIESYKHGYYNNKFEVEARAAEVDGN